MSDDSSESFRVGDQVLYGTEKATVKFVGTTQFSTGLWIGLELENQGML